MEAKLLVVGGEVKTKEVRLRLPSIIGRGKGSNIILPHPLVSRKHCEIYLAGDKVAIRDLGSLNGTYVNNERITETTVEPGELLTVGAVTFRIFYQASGNLDSTEIVPPRGHPAENDVDDERHARPTAEIDPNDLPPEQFIEDNEVEHDHDDAAEEPVEEEMAADDSGGESLNDDDEPPVPSFGGPLFAEDSDGDSSDESSDEPADEEIAPPKGTGKESSTEDDDGLGDFLRNLGKKK